MSVIDALNELRARIDNPPKTELYNKQGFLKRPEPRSHSGYWPTANPNDEPEKKTHWRDNELEHD